MKELDQGRAEIYQGQQQIQGNMGAVSASGKEGTLHSRSVDELGASEDRLRALGGEERSVTAEIERLKAEVDQKLKALT